MPYSVTLLPDGNIVANLREELVTLKPAAADYATGGYLLQGSGSPGTPATANVGLWKIISVICYSGNAGYIVQWNNATNKLQVLYLNVAAVNTGAQLTEVPAGTDLSALTLYLRITGY